MEFKGNRSFYEFERGDHINQSNRMKRENPTGTLRVVSNIGTYSNKNKNDVIDIVLEKRNTE